MHKLRSPATRHGLGIRLVRIATFAAALTAILGIVGFIGIVESTAAEALDFGRFEGY